jgi:hypothetical protein
MLSKDTTVRFCAPLMAGLCGMGCSGGFESIDSGGATGISKQSCGGSLLANCSFEQPVLTPGSYAVDPVGTNVGGWLVVGSRGDVTPCSTSLAERGYTLTSQDGAQAMDVTGTSNTATGVAQTVSTAPGTTYSLSFWVGNLVDPGGPFGTTSTVQVQINGIPVIRAKNSGGAGSMTLSWEQFGFSFTATSNTTTISFINLDPPGDTSNFIDNVLLVPAGP